MLLTGLSAFPITPSDRAGRVDAAALRDLLAPIVAAKADSIGLLGSTGTYAYLSRDERRRAVEVAMEVAGGRIPIVVGVGALRTDEAVRLAQDAKAVGATAGLLAPVSYTPLTDDEVFEHFSVVARESGLPLCIYDNPSTTHFKFSPALVERVSRIAGVVALKTSAPESAQVADHLRELRAAVPDGFSVGYSADWNVTEALLAGADAWYSVVGGLFPDVCMAIVRAARGGDAAEARRLNAQLQPLWDTFKKYSSLRVMYAVAALRGFRVEPPRPLLPLSPSARQEVADALRAAKLS
jgi:4-hydroxy-tetrahydrodipicolinate synthase